MYKKLGLVLDALNIVLILGILSDNYFYYLHKWIMEDYWNTDIKIAVVAIIYFGSLLRIIHVYKFYYAIQNLSAQEEIKEQERINE